MTVHALGPNVAFNLQCSRGHLHYSPEPEKWIGKDCDKPLIHGGTKKCSSPLKRLETERNS